MVGDIIEIIQNHGWTTVGIIALIGVFIQITPIKINPLSWVGKQIKKGLNWFGRQLTEELAEEIKETQNELKEHLKQADEREKKRDIERMKTLRWEILDFGNSVKTKTYRKEAFDHIFESYEEYETYIKENNLTNGQTNRAMSLINSIYNERRNDPEF